MTNISPSAVFLSLEKNYTGLAKLIIHLREAPEFIGAQTGFAGRTADHQPPTRFARPLLSQRVGKTND